MTLFKLGDLLSRDDFFCVLETTQNSQIATMALKPGQESGSLGTDHPGADQLLVVIEGEGFARTDMDETAIKTGDVVLIKAGEDHQFRGGSVLMKTVTFYAPVAYPDES